MPNKTSMSNGNIVKILLIVGFAVLVGFQALVLTGGFQSSSNGFKMSLPDILSSYSGVASSGSVGKYSKLSLNADGYNQLLEYDKTITLSDSEKKNYAGFDILLPCCGFQLTTEDENSDCRCGHHIAMAGLIKKLMKDGHTHDQIQEELNQWKPVFYPECLSQKSLCNL